MHLLYLLPAHRARRQLDLPADPLSRRPGCLLVFSAVIGVRQWGAILGGLAYGFGVRNLGHLTNGFVGHLETLPLPAPGLCLGRETGPLAPLVPCGTARPWCLR